MNFNNELLSWYNRNKRDLPWRHTTDPYVIWLSEIILQQTRVEQGMPYFNRFLEAYPDITSFAAADENDILKLWQGLGYYSRGRNMLKTAKTVQEQFNGAFPSAYSVLIKLKGIGEYTAAAISSFAADEQKAVIDGNVYRVLARYFGIADDMNSTAGKKIFRTTADEVLNMEQPALHNQAMMELGAIICKPKNPACGICPVKESCYAFLHNATTYLPVKINKVKVRERYFNYFLVIKDDTILMNKRDETDIWVNMYDLPLVETTELINLHDLATLPIVKSIFEGGNVITELLPLKKHVLTHQRLFVRLLKSNSQQVNLNKNWSFVRMELLPKLPLPQIISLFIKDYFNL